MKSATQLTSKNTVGLTAKAAALLLAILFSQGMTQAARADNSQPYMQNGVTDTTSTANLQEERARIHTELGAGYYSRGQYAVALDELHQALDSNNRYAPAYDIMGLVYMALNEDKPAEDNFQRALDLAPNEPEIHNNYGWYLCNRKQVPEALKQFGIAIANPLYSKPQSALTNAGICSLKIGKNTDAQAYFEKSLHYDGNQPEAQTELAKLYYQQGRYTEANQLIANLIDDQPSPTLLWLGLRIARKTNDHNAESSDGLALRNRFPDAPETQLLLQGKYD